MIQLQVIEDDIVTNSDFLQWRADPVTKKVFATLQEYLSSIEDNMISTAVILRPDANVVLANMAGIRDGLEMVLNISLESNNND